MNVHWLGDVAGKVLTMALLVLLLGACSPRQMIVGSLADELAGQA